MEESGRQTASGNSTLAGLLSSVPRLVQDFFRLPGAMDHFTSLISHSPSLITEATGQKNTSVISSTATIARSGAKSTVVGILDGAFRQGWGSGPTELPDTPNDEHGTSIFAMAMQGLGRLKNFGGIFTYLTSRWALATFAAAIVLNRTQFYASSRENIRLQWYMRIALYTVPIVGFLVQMLHVLQALKCQTSPDFPLLRHGDPLKHISIEFGGEGGLPYYIASTLLFWQDDGTCCVARNMSLVPLGNGRGELRGSMSLLFRFFISLCTSQLIETLVCALQRTHPMPETGMTIFEHSLAFAECEAMISNALGFGFFGVSKLDGPLSSSPADSGASLVSRGEILRKLNVPPEVLLICLISCFSHLSSSALAIIGIRHRVRLINTGIWALCYIFAFLWSFSKVVFGPVESVADLGILRFPTVCIVGFIPHLLVLVGILVCAVVYALALFVTAVSVPPEVSNGMSFRQRFAWAYGNLQANVQFSSTSSIRIRMSEDFYTTLLKVGFIVLTAASEAVYLNEGSRVHLAQMTWLEQKRIDELALEIETRRISSVPAELLGEGIAKGVEFVDRHNVAISRTSPYARERKSRPRRTLENDNSNHTDVDTGLGLTQRRNRMQLTLDLIVGILWLAVVLLAQLAMNMLRRFGVERHPEWLLKAAGRSEEEAEQRCQSNSDDSGRREHLEFWMLNQTGDLVLPTDGNVDVEAETRRRLTRAGTFEGEESLTDTLYRWWKNGGWFGDIDGSGDYQAPTAMDEQDTTSVVSTATDASEVWEREPTGQRTPTQEDPFGNRQSRESTPSTPKSGLDTSHLARLLNPQTIAERDEARMLSHSLQSAKPLTRARYRREVEYQRMQLLAPHLNEPSSWHGNSQELDQEEDRAFELFILTRRANGKSNTTATGAWEAGAEGMGAAGPQCVVCQSSPRTILVWPCGCLSMCDECRVGLAARNYTKCICCRADLVAYSRLYVP